VAHLLRETTSIKEAMQIQIYWKIFQTSLAIIKYKTNKIIQRKLIIKSMQAKKM